MSHRLLFGCLVPSVLAISNGASAQNKTNLVVPGADHVTRQAAIEAREGDWQTFFDTDGRRIGTSTTTWNKTFFRDPSGGIVGYSERSGDSIRFYDPSNNLTATVSIFGSQINYRNAGGTISESWSNSQGSTSFRDGAGNYVGGASRSPHQTSLYGSRGRFADIIVSNSYRAKPAAVRRKPHR